jgi:hypothetical protein
MGTEEKKAKRKSGAGWLVVSEDDGLLTKYYSGHDRAKARAAVEANLGKRPVSVLRVTRVSTFTAEDLEPKLVKKF